MLAWVVSEICPSLALYDLNET